VPDAFICDHVRTRAAAKAAGTLHEVTAALATRALATGAQQLDQRADDVVLGCVDPVGEAGGGIARAAAITAAATITCQGADQPLLRVNSMR
jgi:acetyl-CoA C-acetyltransferase